jgi:hypothetical protein
MKQTQTKPQYDIKVLMKTVFEGTKGMEAMMKILKIDLL